MLIKKIVNILGEKIMKLIHLLTIFFILPLSHIHAQDAQHLPHYDWLIIGAGPSGIATLGVLIDIGVNPEKICWLDPEFNVGRMGAHYSNVPANSKTKEFVYFVNACKVFQECADYPAMQALLHYDLEQRYTLGIIIEPLKCITSHLRTKIQSVQESLSGLYFEKGMWQVVTNKDTRLTSQHVVLATGCYPRTLDYENQKIIPLDIALDQSALKTLVTADDIVGVVGGAHSAILLLKFLSEMPVKFIYNLYKTPIEYAPSKRGLFEELFYIRGTSSGIKGTAAEWAQNVLEKNPPANLQRILSTDENLKNILGKCTKVIYALGYDRNPLPLINGTTPITSYNEKTGMIAPGLFGVGLAFPDKRLDEPSGQEKYCIGFDCFMEYALHMVPQWVANDAQHEKTKQALDQVSVFKKMEELFTVYAL